MNNKTKAFLFLLSAILIISSSKKDDVVIPTIPPVTKKPYLVSTIQHTVSGTDSLFYKYTGNAITRMDYYYGTTSGGFYNYTNLPDSNIIWWSYNTLPANEKYSFILLRDADKMVSLTRKQHNNNIDYTVERSLFHYIGDKIDKVYFTEDMGNQNLDTTGFYSVIYTGDDITKITANDLSGGNGSVFDGEYKAYTYDNNLNGFASVNKNYWILGYNYRNTETFDLYDVIVANSKHTIISEEINGAPIVNYTFTKDAQGNIIASSGGGSFNLEYR